MARILIVILFFAVFTIPAFAAADTSMPVNPSPVTTQVLGEDEASLPPAKFPRFSNSGDNPTCDEYLNAEYPDGLSLAPICTRSEQGDGTIVGECRDYSLVPGLKVDAFEIPEAYRKSATILVTWTVRIEGYGTQGYDVRPQLCTSWNGTSEQTFPEGLAKTRLYGNGKLLGQDAVMTIPEGKSVTITQTQPKGEPGDPTHTGSYLITAADFDGELPATIDIELKWINETSMKIVSPAKMRSLIITLTPIGGTKG